MRHITPTLAFGFHAEDRWISRFTRFQADLPPGRHRLMGEIYCPPLHELAGNELQLAMNSRPLGSVLAAEPPRWHSFTLDLPALAEAQRCHLLLRTTRFFCPPPPEDRLLGLLLDNFLIALNFD